MSIVGRLLLLNHRNFSAKQNKNHSVHLIATAHLAISWQPEVEQKMQRGEALPQPPQDSTPSRPSTWKAERLRSLSSTFYLQVKKNIYKIGVRGEGAGLPRAVGAPGLSSRVDARAGMWRPPLLALTHKSRPPGPPQRASRLYSGGFFFSLPPKPTEPQTRQHRERHRKTELMVDPRIAAWPHPIS